MAIIWTKEWQGSDDGTILKGIDLKNIQDDLSIVQTVGDVLSIPGQAQGDVLYFDGTNWVGLPAGTSGQALLTQGAGSDPIFGDVVAGDLTIAGQTTGNLLYYDGANWIRIAPGTSGDVLTSNGPGVAPSYETPGVVAAGAMTLVSTTTVTSSTNSGNIAISAEKYWVFYTLTSDLGGILLDLVFDDDVGATKYAWKLGFTRWDGVASTGTGSSASDDAMRIGLIRNGQTTIGNFQFDAGNLIVSNGVYVKGILAGNESVGGEGYGEFNGRYISDGTLNTFELVNSQAQNMTGTIWLYKISST